MTDQASRYLIDERPLTIQPTLIKVFGFEQATVLQQFHWLIGQPRTGIVHDAQKWIWGTYEQWCEDYFPFWEPRTLRYHIGKLKKTGVLISEQLRKADWDRTNYYTIDYKRFDALMRQHVAASSRPDDDTSMWPDDAASYIGTEKTTEKTSEKTAREDHNSYTQPDANTRHRNGSAPPPITTSVLEESFDGPADKEPRVEVSRPVGRKRPTPPIPPSPRYDPRKFDRGLIAAGGGETPVEVYYESFSIRDDDARLDALAEDDLTKLCPDLDRLREVCTTYRRTSYRKGNLQLILDWYREGTPTKKGSTNAKTQRTTTPAGSDRQLEYNERYSEIWGREFRKELTPEQAAEEYRRLAVEFPGLDYQRG